MTIQHLIRNTRTIKPTEVVGESIEATKQALIRLQRLQMLMGYRSDGKRIGKYRNKDYAVTKAVQNPLAGFGFMDLRLEGYFQNDIFVDVRENSMVFGSVNEKTPDLVNRVGETIFGLNAKNRAEYVNSYLRPEAVKRFKEQILKK